MPNQNQNILHHIEDFRRVLAAYEPSPETKQTLAETSVVLLVGPTAAGRNTLINILVGTGRYHYIVSDTTRLPRVNNGVPEQDGVEYWFKSEDEFLSGLEQGAYLEAAIIHNQQVSGISVAELAQASRDGKIALSEIEPDGAAHIHSYTPGKLFVFLLPPSFDVWMERIHGRGEMTHEELVRRLTSAQEEIATALAADYYQFVVNNEVHEAATAVDELANGRSPDMAKQARGRDHAEQLLVDVQLYLESIV